jgi:hypothetical protein
MTQEYNNEDYEALSKGINHDINWLEKNVGSITCLFVVGPLEYEVVNGTYKQTKSGNYIILSFPFYKQHSAPIYV